MPVGDDILEDVERVALGISADAVLDAAERLLGTKVGARFARDDLVGTGDLARQEAL